MTDSNKRKEYCDAADQKDVVEKMVDCDRKSKTDKEKSDCYSQVVKEDDGCMSS